MASAPPFRILGYGHTGITVRSMSSSLHFWTKTLGLPIIWEQTFPVGVAGEITGAPPGTTMEVAFVGLPQTPHAGGSSEPSHISTLELIEYVLPADLLEEQKAQTPQARSWDIGAAHICLKVRGLDSIIERVKAEGFHIYNGIYTVPQDSSQAAVTGRRVCYLRGSDGEI